MSRGGQSRAVVELYNLHHGYFPSGNPIVSNGWLVARILPDGRRANTLKRFGADETAARAYAALWNGPDGEGVVSQ